MKESDNNNLIHYTSSSFQRKYANWLSASGLEDPQKYMYGKQAIAG